MRMIVLAVLAASASAMPAAAQDVAGPGVPPPAKPQTLGPVSRNAPINGVLVLYGNERCPTDKDGNEIVVCTRRDASEQFRVPKELREFKITPQNESWALRQRDIVGPYNDAAGGIGSCSTVGPGGSTGCFLRQARQARAENADRKKEEAAAP